MTTAAELIERMRDHSPPRDVYLTAKGDYALLYGGGHVERQAIVDALHAGWITPKWSDKPELEYWRLVTSGK